MALRKNPTNKTLDDFLKGKSEHTLGLFHHFVREFQKTGNVTLTPAKTMIGIATPNRRVAYITQLGKNFVHVVFPFEKAYTDNLCFQKIAEVPVAPGAKPQFNHHFRMLEKADVNKEVKGFMRRAVGRGNNFQKNVGF